MSLGYLPRSSFVHRLDPRIKLAWFVAVTTLMTTWLDPLWVSGLFLSVLAFAAAARVPLGGMLRGLVAAIPLMLVVFVLNILLYRPPGQPVLIGHLMPAMGGASPRIPVYLETLIFSLGLAMRILVSVSSVMLLTRILSPSDLAIALVKLGLPPEVGMAISMAIAFAPMLIHQITEVLEAQQSRGWEAGGRFRLLGRVRAFLPVLMPTFFRSYIASEEMAAAMLARGFGFDMRIRTEMNPLTFRTADKVLGVVLAVLVVTGFALSHLGYADYHFTCRLIGALQR